MTEQEAMDAALELCKGSYQESIIMGYSAWSGADLKGKARKYGGSYLRSRKRLLERVQGEGIPCTVAEGKHGKLHLILGQHKVDYCARVYALAALGIYSNGQCRNEIESVVE